MIRTCDMITLETYSSLEVGIASDIHEPSFSAICPARLRDAVRTISPRPECRLPQPCSALFCHVFWTKDDRQHVHASNILTLSPNEA